MSAGICSDLSLAPAGINGLRPAAKHPVPLLLRHQNEVMINEQPDLEVGSQNRCSPRSAMGSSGEGTILLPGCPSSISSFFVFVSVYHSLSPHLSCYSLIFILTLFFFFITSFCSFPRFSSTFYYFHSSPTSSLFLYSPYPNSYFSHLHFILLWSLHAPPPLLWFLLYCLLILPLRVSLL
jgi:hypothetical protein